MARPSLADSLRASLSKGVHVDTAEKIAHGFSAIPVEPSFSSVIVAPVFVSDPYISPIIVTEPAVVIEPVTMNSIITEPAKHQAHEQTKQPDQYPARYPVKEPVKQAAQSCYPDKEPDKEPDIEPAKHEDKEPVSYPDKEPVLHQTKYPAYNPAKQIDPELWYPYTEKQGRVLLYLILAGGGTKREDIAKDTSVNIATVKYSLRLFVKDGFISPTKLDVNHTMRGFKYAINPHLCNEYAARILGTKYIPDNHPANYPVNRPPLGPVDKSVSYPVNKLITPFSSSSSLKDLKPTTTTVSGILDDSELKFWKGEGVTEKQVQNWMSEFQLSVEEISLALRYGKFDILERGDVQNAANWFYKILIRTGMYPKPPNYRSLVELRAEALQQQKSIDDQAKAKVEALSLDDNFRKFLDDPGDPLYQQLFSKVSGFAKEQFQSGQLLAAEVELKELFKNRRL